MTCPLFFSSRRMREILTDVSDFSLIRFKFAAFACITFGLN